MAEGSSNSDSLKLTTLPAAGAYRLETAFELSISPISCFSPTTVSGSMQTSEAPTQNEVDELLTDETFLSSLACTPF